MMHAKPRLNYQQVFFVIIFFTLGVIVLLAMMTAQLRTGPPKIPTPRMAVADRKAQFPAYGTAKNASLQEDELLAILQDRFRNYTGPRLHWNNTKCPMNVTGAQPCLDGVCPRQFSSLSLRERLRQVLATRAPIPPRYLQAVTSAAKAVTSHKYIFVTGASSNHYKEMQALLDNAFKELFPRMKGQDFAFVVYNLGLDAKERRLTEKHCNCTLIDFPFSGLPDFVKFLNCYVWKPLIIASLLEKAEYVVWMDASIRWRPKTPLEKMFRRARVHGYQTRHNLGSIAQRSQASMAQFFGDHLCQYAPFTEMETGLGFYYNDRFMREAVMQPWLSCAFNTSCMCVPQSKNLKNCGEKKGGKNALRYAACHRFEQSAIGMMLSKLSLDYRPMFYVPDNAVAVRKGHEMNWFENTPAAR